jgi:hypothetical protein
VTSKKYDKLPINVFVISCLSVSLVLTKKPRNLNSMQNPKIGSSYITLRLGTLTIWMTVIISATPLKYRVWNQFMWQLIWETLNTTDSCTHKNILPNPSIGVLAINSPQNSKYNAKWADCKSKVWNSSNERYFHKRLRSRFKPSEWFHNISK